MAVVRIVHASISENGTVNGRPGDQTGSEVCIRDLYDRGWHTVMRPISGVWHHSLIDNAIKAANNDNIGYSQGDRYSLFDLVADCDLSDLSSDYVREKVNCDCSSLISALLYAADLPANREMWTGNEVDWLSVTGYFNPIAYVGAKLEPGDILVANGHTAIVIEVKDSVEAGDSLADDTKIEFADSFDSSLAGIYESVTLINVRSGAGVDKEVIATVVSQTGMHNYGYYTMDHRGVMWLLVKLPSSKIGFVSERVVVKRGAKE